MDSRTNKRFSMPEVKKPHILLFNRSFWPDIEATGQFLTELCVGLSPQARFTVIAGRSYYAKECDFRFCTLCRRERYEDIEILRVRHTRFWKKRLLGRLINWLTYCISAFIAALRTDPDLIIVSTDPPFLGAVAAAISRMKRVPLVYNCRDLYPDVAWGLGRLKERDLLSRVYDYLNKKAMRNSSVIVCLGESMQERIIKKGIPIGRLRVIPDWADTSIIKPIVLGANPLTASLGIREDKFIVMHSGNLGFSQNFPVILEAASRVKEKDRMSLVFVGDGVAKNWMQQEVRRRGMENVLFLPYQPKENLCASLNLADLHIVSLKKGMAGSVVPSKIYAILAAGKAFLAITEKDCEAARLARLDGCGLWADCDDVDGISRAIDWAIRHPEQLQAMGEKGRLIAQDRFDKNIVIREWRKLLQDLGGWFY